MTSLDPAGTLIADDPCGEAVESAFPGPFDEVSAHDLIQPLPSVKMQAEMLARHVRGGTLADGDLLRGLDSIAERAAAMADQIVAALKMGREPAEPLGLRLERCDLADVVRAAVAALAPQDRDRVFLSAPSPAVGRWDRERLARVAGNLIANALKYSPRERRVAVDVHASAEGAELVVRDHGLGLEQSELELIFTRSFRSPRALASGVRGIGLGLYAFRLIVEGHGGRILAQAAGAGRGSGPPTRPPPG